MRTLCKHIFASAERNFNAIIPSLGDTLTLMQECFKNIRDVDKKIRLLEFYVFGNVTVAGFWRSSFHGARADAICFGLK